MCGILGVMGTGPDLSYSSLDVIRAMKLMQYRGPDAADCFSSPDGQVVIGHLRLSIHDLTDAGKQPMHLKTASGYYSIVFNGEVYNFHEIRNELIELGYHFDTGTDTEVVLSAYAAWGDECVKKFNGMFAIAIYSHDNETLFLSRDRLGKKPLYYFRDETSGEFFFASEIKSILALRPDLASRPIEASLIDAYMTLGFTPGENTLYTGIKRLLPSHNLTVSGGKARVSRYWSLHFPSTQSIENELAGVTDQSLIKHGKKLFADSLSLRLRSDVDVGVFLSGGLDSSAVVAGLSEAGMSLNTYSVKFDGGRFGSKYDETSHAEEVSKLFGTNHQTIVMTPELFQRLIPDYVRIMDEPVTEAAALSLGVLSGLATKDVTVVLSGEGADELFGGYEIYQRMMIMEKIRTAITPWGAKAAAFFASGLPAGNKLRKYAEMTAQPFTERYRGVSVYPSYYRESLYNSRTKALLSSGESSDIDAFYATLFSQTKDSSLLSKMLNFDTSTWLVDDLLIKADRMSMMHSLELRCPFLDFRLVEFAARLPDRLKIKNGDPKWILKEWYRGVLPDSVVDRKKLGFPTPLQQIFQSDLREYVFDTLTSESSPLLDYFDRDAIQKLCHEHFSRQRDHHTVLWQLIVLGEYLEQRKSMISNLSFQDGDAA